MARRAKPSKEDGLGDPELEDLPPELRWREWMGRVEAAIFASPQPVPREILEPALYKLPRPPMIAR
jgi:segregation and condensation protein B